MDPPYNDWKTVTEADDKMPHISMIFNSIISGTNDFCCLCLKITQDQHLNVGDEIAVDVNGSVQNVVISEVLHTIFGAEFYSNNVNISETLCEDCTRSAISSYGFIQGSVQNAKNLAKLIGGIDTSFDYIVDEFCNKKSTLYVSLNVDDLTSTHYYDPDCTVTSKEAALKRFQSLMHKYKSEQEKITSIEKRKSVHADISLTEIMLDSSQTENVVCIECFDIFPNASNLKEHYMKTHSATLIESRDYSDKINPVEKVKDRVDNLALACYNCGKVYNSKKALRNHEVSHNPKQMYVCEDCGRVYKGRNSYYRHIEAKVCGRDKRALPCEAQLTCDICNKKYSQKATLRVHIQHAHGKYKNHICEWCGMNFWSASRLKAHTVKHTQVKNFICTICDGKFVTKESLLYHTRRHTGETPYKCPHCDSSFLSASRRSSHFKRHHSQKGDHECEICHSKFTLMIHLQKHKKNHHFTIYKGDEKPFSKIHLTHQSSESVDVS